MLAAKAKAKAKVKARVVVIVVLPPFWLVVEEAVVYRVLPVRDWLFVLWAPVSISVSASFSVQMRGLDLHSK